ncbi:MAG: RsmE family RNA methyltransferase [Victivallales bacterium]|nr:RsmE family RNA methyltransferase [Victivallales bacterium]
MHCFYCRAIGRPGTTVELEERDRKHLFKTLRAAPGEQFELTDGRGTFALATIGSDRIITVLNATTASPPPRRVHLVLAPPKKAKMDLLLKQCAEVGIWSIHLFLSARSVAAPEKEEVLERWQTLLQEGCKQAKNPFLPQLTALPVSFKTAVDRIKQENWQGFFGSPRGDGVMPDLSRTTDIAWVVGPEGGFTPEEEDYLRQNGIADLRLGRWVLRVETAAIAGSLFLAVVDTTTP